MTQVNATKTIVAAGNYTAGDVLSESATDTFGTAWVFGGIENRAGAGAHIDNAWIIFSGSGADAVTAVYKLWLFSNNPSTSELDDNAAKSFSAADMANFLGIITFQAAVDQGAVAVAMIDLTKTPNPLHVVPINRNNALGVIGGVNGGASRIWGVLEDTSGETNEAAGMTATITLNVEPAIQLQQ